MSELTRFGVSIASDILATFDKQIKLRNYETRSKAITDLIQADLSRVSISGNMMIAGAVTFMYDHHSRDLMSKLVDIQHNYHDTVISMQHIHLDHDNCLEILAVRGKADNINDLYNQIRALKGIKQANISIA